MYSQRIERKLEVSAPLERVWELISHTNRLNRSLGIPAMETGELGGDGTHLYRRMRLGGTWGWLAGWRNYPVDWVKHRSLRAFREFESGLLTHWLNEVSIEPITGGTRLHFVSELGTKHRRMRPMLVLLLRWLVHRAERDLLRDIAAQRDFIPLPSVHPISPAIEGRLAEFPILREGSSPISDCLRRHLLEADDEEVRRMQPFALADRWGVSRDETLRFFLQATHAGALEMSWELLCPNCRVPKGKFTSLRQLNPRIHCEVCELDFEAKLDEFIELRFTVSRRVRETSDAVFCIGSPSNTPHILAQVSLRPGESREIGLDLPAETVRCRALRAPIMAILTSDAKRGREEMRIEFLGRDWRTAVRAFTPGPVRLQLRNQSATAASVAVECLAWESRAVTAAHVTSLQEFRSLFALEALPSGAQVGVRAITILFTDLKGSTELYEEVGDADAFTRVRKHFDFIQRCIAAERGAVVKTMGDAVMGVFSDPADALRAALAMQRGIDAFCRDAGIEPALELKIGIHHGAAISFQGESAIDYFGCTVNIAARAQGQSEGRDIVITRAVSEAPSVQSWLKNQPLHARAFRSRFKGIREEQELVRLTLRPLKLRLAA